jgi:hypothetical protein
MVNPADIREHTEVFGSDGEFVGKVDRVEGRSIKLTKDAPEARGEHRFLPIEWVEKVDKAVHLRKPAPDVREEWQAHPVEEGEYTGAEK